MTDPVLLPAEARRRKEDTVNKSMSIMKFRSHVQSAIDQNWTISKADLRQWLADLNELVDPTPAADAGRSRLNIQAYREKLDRPDGTIRFFRDDVELLLAEVSRLTVERDTLQRGNATALRALDASEATLASLLQRLRALEQQWRIASRTNDSITGAFYPGNSSRVALTAESELLKWCAAGLASLLAASEGEP